MSYLEILGLVVTGGGTLASILGVFFAIYAKQNGKVTRGFMAEENKNMKEFIAYENKDMREFIAYENKDMREFMAQENRNMREFLASVLERMDRKGEERHLEVLSRIEKSR
ncbi:MAG: hypothetical protein AB1797_12645 [bacterium]